MIPVRASSQWRGVAPDLGDQVHGAPGLSVSAGVASPRRVSRGNGVPGVPTSCAFSPLRPPARAPAAGEGPLGAGAGYRRGRTGDGAGAERGERPRRAARRAGGGSWLQSRGVSPEDAVARRRLLVLPRLLLLAAETPVPLAGTGGASGELAKQERLRELVCAPGLLEAEVAWGLPEPGLAPAPPPTLRWHLPLAQLTANSRGRGAALAPCHPPTACALPLARASHFPCPGLRPVTLRDARGPKPLFTISGFFFFLRKKHHKPPKTMFSSVSFAKWVCVGGWGRRGWLCWYLFFLCVPFHLRSPAGHRTHQDSLQLYTTCLARSRCSGNTSW